MPAEYVRLERVVTLTFPTPMNTRPDDHPQTSHRYARVYAAVIVTGVIVTVICLTLFFLLSSAPA